MSSPDVGVPPISSLGTTALPHRPGALPQTLILVPRATKNMLRGYPELIGHLSQGIILGFVLGLVYFQLKGQPNDIQSLKAYCFQLPFAFTYLTQVVWIWKWCANLVMFDRELEDGLYAPGPWVIAELVAWLPVNVASPVIFCLFTYLMGGLRRDHLPSNLGLYVATMTLLQQCILVWSLLAASVEVCDLSHPY